MQMTVNCVLVTGDTAKEKSDSIWFLMFCQSWILAGDSYCPQVALPTMPVD